jgi:hypothetical protein
VAHLTDKKKFARTHRVPTVPADQAGYNPKGGYWRGSVWAPTTMMVVRGLERCGREELAREIALNHLRNVVAVFKKTGTIWENYAPDSVAPGSLAKRNFVGWSGIGPIVFLIEHAIGIKADAASNTVVWTITSPKRVGIERFWFGGNTVSLICEEAGENGKRVVTASADKPFKLVVILNGEQFPMDVPAGKQARTIP